MTPQPTVLADAGTASSPKLVTLDNAATAAPTMSVPVASNLNKAPLKVTSSETFAFDGSGASETLPPMKVPKAALGKPETVVTARAGAIPDGQGTRVIATFAPGSLDGDTIPYRTADPKQGVPNSGPKNVCRVDYADSPEKSHGADKPGQPYGPEAGRILEQMIANKELTIKVSKVDSNKRNVCQIEIEGRALDAELVKAGAAMLYQRYVPFADARRPGLEAAEAEAKKAKRGIWGLDKPPVEPETWRRTMWSK